MNKSIRNILIFIIIPIVAIVGVGIMINNFYEVEKEKYSQIIEYFDDGNIKEFSVNPSTGELTYVLKEKVGNKEADKKYSVTLASVSLFIDDVNEQIRKYNQDPANKDNKIVYDLERGADTGWLTDLIPMAIMIVVVVIFWMIMSRRMGKMMGDDKTMSFGKIKARKPESDKRKTTFADVAGADEEKAELVEIVEFLKAPKKFNDMGARIPKGVLLVGPPGTGKTLLARAVAGEAGVPFFSISGSDFVEMFVGVGASRVRDLFDQAKKQSPAIIFIDEIDAVGRQRGAGLGGGHDEREQTLNQLLVEMDGFGANEGVIIIAATNRPDILDKALLRPGRFDRQVTVNYPDAKGREEILKVHARGKPLAPDVSLKTIARSSAGFTGADLENLLNEAALLAVRKGNKSITEENIEEATIKVVMGAEKKSHIISDKDKLITSYHEAGHAIVSYFLPTQDPVHQISIVPRGMAAGYTMYLPTEDKGHTSKKELLEDIASLLGGRAAEELTQDDICTGASNDIERATNIARTMITRYGMSEKLGPIVFGKDDNEVFLGRDFSSTPNYSEKIAALIDEETDLIVKTQHNCALEILRNNMAKLHEVAKFLFENEKMDADQFEKLMTSNGDAIVTE